MDAAGLGLAAAGLCIKYGKQLHAICKAYRSADREIRQSILCIEDIWLKTQSQVEVIAKLWNSLDERVQIHHHHMLSLLEEKLQRAITIVNRLDTLASKEPLLRDLMINTKGDLKKVNYAVSTKKRLEEVIQDLDLWQRKFDPSWYLLARLTASVLDQQPIPKQATLSKELFIIQQLRRAHYNSNEPIEPRSSVFLSHQYPILERKKIANTSTETGHAANQAIVIDSLRISNANNIEATTKDVRDIARTLANVDSSVFSLLACQGVIKVYDSLQVTGFEFIFTFPTGLSEPQSLRTILLATNRRYPLDDRFQLAKLLARSVSFLHTAQIVHKNVSPETILLFKDPESELGIPFLVGFEKFRRAEGQTYMSGDALWEKNLYRHPRRQGERPEEEYKMQHDIYSLGVCLLEIGLETSFVCFEPTSVSDHNPKGAIPNTVLEITEYLKVKDIRKRAFQIKRSLEAMAEDQLPSRMGKVYTNVVLSCLTCLDPDNQRFGDQSGFTDDDGILVGVRYIEKILYQLEEIRF